MAAYTYPGATPTAPPTMSAPAQVGGGQIGGSLPFGQMGATNTLPTDPASLASHYGAAYNSALAMNSSNYSNILAGYQQTMAQQQTAQGAIGAGYTGLYNNVLGQLAGQGQEQRQQINSDYAAGLGAQSQQLINRGLGNTTVQSAVQRGLAFDQARAGNALSEQLGRQNADYMTNIGGQGLQFQNQANMQNTQLAQNQLGWMNSVNAPYPDAGIYAQLAQQYGATAEANKQRNQLGRNGYPGQPAMGGTLSGQYGTHFPNDFRGGNGAAPVQLGGGGGGYGSGLPPGFNPGQGQGQVAGGSGGTIPTLDYSVGSYGDVWNDQTTDPYSGSYDQWPASDLGSYNLSGGGGDF